MKYSPVLALLFGTSAFFSVKAADFNSLRSDFYKNCRTNPAEAVKLTQEMRKLPKLTKHQMFQTYSMELTAAYNMKDPAPCVETAKKVLAMKDAPADLKTHAYYLGGIKLGAMQKNEEFLQYMIEGEKIAPTAASKFNLMVFHIDALRKLKRKDDAIKQAEKTIAFAKENKKRDWELNVHYTVSSVYPQNERIRIFEELLKASDVFEYPYGQHIARVLLNVGYKNDPVKAKALCERVLKEAKRVIYPDFKRKLDQLSK